MIRYRLLPLSLVSVMLGCQGMAQSPTPPSPPTTTTSKATTLASAQLTLDAAPSIKCPAGQACDGKPDYRALLWQSGGAEVYISFSGDLPADERNPANLNRHFSYADIYIPQPDGRILAVHAASDVKAEAQLRFLSSSSGRLHAQLIAKQHRSQSDGNPADATCRTDDMQGVCRRETVVNTPLTLDLDLAWPASK
ncbi:hypothetical protein ACUHMQ_03595 [Chitinimonas sp. PSY-7]|uniref:hypothetical protein n=1 Tax=Chitinimonas sp. PSY-7 TaxID=3459088 RepID=UPI0040401A01